VADRTALSVPVSALLYEGTERVLFVKRGEGFAKIRVKVGAQQAGRAEILEGIADGDEVVTRGAQLLFGELFRSGIPSEADGDAGEKDDDEDSGGR
jgi:Cu(I)/Ag(I) efflux system membrane fusion protein